MQMMFRVAGWITMLFASYLMLALVATYRMKVEYHRFLPPFGSEWGGSLPRGVVMLAAAWIGACGLACLYAAAKLRAQRRISGTPDSSL